MFKLVDVILMSWMWRSGKQDLPKYPYWPDEGVWGGNFVQVGRKAGTFGFFKNS